MAQTSSNEPVARLKPSVQWIALIVLSIGLGTLLTHPGVPAAMLLGPMLAGIAISAGGGRPQLDRRAFLFAEGIIGCMVAKMLPRMGSSAIGLHWPLFVAGAVSVIAASGFLGWLLTRMRVLPGTTALWGLSPGAATAMTLMAEAYGADTELVAFMQYVRVVIVAAIASVIAKIWSGSAHHAAAAAIWFPAIAWIPFAKTMALAIAGPVLGRRLGIRAGALLLPLVAGVLLVHHGLMTIELPHWMLAVAYAFIGWRIGLRFTRPLLVHALKTLPQIIACTLALIAFCGGLSALLVLFNGIDPLTAYLAMSPGGADTVAIIAASSRVDTPFVMTMQMLRFVAVLVAGPAMARFLAGRAGIAPQAQQVA